MSTINDISLLDLNKKYSYADYLTWSIRERLELINGGIYQIFITPSTLHQKISSLLLKEIFKTLGEQPCQVFHAPFDVRLPKKEMENQQIFTVVQPDICIICDHTKIDDKGCIGAPDLIIEILSPGNTSKEMKNKFEAYEESGVREYWLIEPQDKAVLIFVLENGKFIGKRPMVEEETLQSFIFPDLKIDLQPLFRKAYSN